MSGEFMRSHLLALALACATPVIADPEWVRAKVIKIDADNGRITLKHERIKSLPMEAMTMRFKVDSTMVLAKVKVGQHVRFTVAEKNDHLVVTALEPVQ
jgi:Cu(I)/Ag(I) efflux system protein CusF